MKREQIKDLYNCNKIEITPTALPLEIWYNNLIHKTIDEIELNDVLIMLRQKELMELAIEKALLFLDAEPFCGELYEGELLLSLCEIDEKYLQFYRENLLLVLNKVIVAAENFEWEYCEDQEEICKAATKLINRCNK